MTTTILILFTGLFLANTATASGSTIYVDVDNIVGPWDGTSDRPFKNIQDGIDAASENYIVSVSTGTYYESIVIEKTINVTGNGKGKSVIDGSLSKYVVDITTSNNVTIQGFTIRNGGTGIRIKDSSNNTIKESTIEQSYYGIYIDNSSNNTIYQNNFINNTQNAYDEHNNIWNDDPPKGGNYWDDYTGVDANSDGFGDTTFAIPGSNNWDMYPIIEPITESPHVNFTYSPLIPTTQNLIQFTDSSEDLDGYIASWLWDFGDKNTSSVQNPTHQYSDNGIYTITLNVTDDYGVVNQTSKNINVLNVEPTADFDYSPDIPTDLQNISFSDSSEDLDGCIASWLWNFGDGNTSDLQNPGHQYSDDGTYTVTLNVTDDDGAETSITQEIIVLNVKPTANFAYTPNNPVANDTLQYTDNSIDHDGIIISWSWDLGDGTTSTERSPTHEYTSIGTYKVSLTVTDDDGDSDTKIKNVKIYGLPNLNKDYKGSIVLFIVFLVMFLIMIGTVVWLHKKHR